MAEARRALRIVLIAYEGAVLEAVEATGRRCPPRAGPSGPHGEPAADRSTGSSGSPGSLRKRVKRPLSRWKRLRPPPSVPHPQGAVAILEDRHHGVVGERPRVARVMGEGEEAVAVVAVQPVLGSEPHEPGAVLEDTGDEGLGKALLQGDASELDALLTVSAHPRPGNGQGQSEAQSRQGPCQGLARARRIERRRWGHDLLLGHPCVD